ncbi:MAG: transposase, partial [Spirochaetaceae bacterium]|nr:transposase [Spirochaetaceae bacterium]
MASKYTEEQKLAAVQAYIRGEGGIRQVARNHEVSRGALIQWVA